MNAKIETSPGWDIVAIGDVCELATGGTPSKSEKAYFGGEIKWLVSGDVHKKEIFDCEGRITEEGLNNSNARFLPPNSVIIALNGQGKTRGTVALLRTKATCNQSLVSIYPKNVNQLVPEFIFWNLRGRYDEIRRMTGDSGSERRGLNMPLLRSIQIPLPPHDEQKRIVALLDQAFAALDRARANAEANLTDAQELFDNALLAIFDELLPVAASMTLSDAASDFSRGKSKHRPRNDPALYGGDYPFIQTGDIRRSIGSVREYSQTYNDVGLAQSKLWPVGTVCITIAANIAETGVLEFEGCFPDSVIGMVPNPKIANAYYVEYMLRYFAKELKLKGKGSAQDNINLATFENAKFPFPSLERQLAVVEKLDGVAANVETMRANYDAQLSDLAALRQSLLQKAFAGDL